MRIFAPGSAAAHIDIDRAIANLNRKCVEIIAASGEAAAAFHVVAPSVPVTSKNAVADSSTCQWISHMRALVICGIDVALVLKKRDAAAVDFDGFWSAFGHIFDFRYPNKIIRHCSLLRKPLLLIFKRLHRCSSLRKAHRGVSRRSAVLVRSNISSVTREPHKQLVPRRMNAL